MSVPLLAQRSKAQAPPSEAGGTTSPICLRRAMSSNLHRECVIRASRGSAFAPLQAAPDLAPSLPLLLVSLNPHQGGK
jgi:hypothetical protein